MAKPKAAKKPAPEPEAEPERAFGGFVVAGDVVRIERRYVVEGSLTSVSDRGRFRGVQAFGTVEHLVLEAEGETRTIPLATISEIALVEAAGRKVDADDPSVA